MNKNKNCLPPDFPEYCPPPLQPCEPLPIINDDYSIIKQVNRLTERINLMNKTYNDVMANCYATLKNLQCAAEENGAYYDPCSVYVETGYYPDESATYSLIHKKVVDRHGEPIRIKLHLAYGNTTNSEIEQDIFSASKIEYADKIVVAQPLRSGGWYGQAIYNGAPIKTSDDNKNLYTVGFTRAGVMRVYPNNTSTDQMIRDTIENAMGCSGILIQNGQATEDSFINTIPRYSDQVERVCIGQNTDTREVIILTCGNEDNVSKRGMTSKACQQILLQYGCDIAVELCEDANAGAMDKGQLMFIPKNNDVPTSYCYWYISRKCYYRNDYQRELAELMQNYGECIWQSYLTKLSVNEIDANLKNVQDDLATEIQERIDGDEALEKKINAETERATQAESNLDNKIDNEISRATNAETELDTKIESETTRATDAEENLNTKIDNETKRATESESSLNTAIENETSRATSKESELEEKYGELQQTVSKLNSSVTAVQNTLSEIQGNISNINEQVTVINQEVNNIKSGATQLPYLKNTGDTMNGVLNMSHHTIQNIASPVNDNDAATKSYVDSHSGGGGGGEGYLPTAGGTMTGNISMNNTAKVTDMTEPVSDSDAATKSYVDKKTSGLGTGDFKSDGSIPMTGDLNMGTHRITKLADSRADDDAVTQKQMLNVATQVLENESNISSIKEQVSGIQQTVTQQGQDISQAQSDISSLKTSTQNYVEKSGSTLNNGAEFIYMNEAQKIGYKYDSDTDTLTIGLIS